MSTAISQDLRIRSEGKVEVVEGAIARFQAAAKSLDANAWNATVPRLAAAERDALAEIERLEPGAELLSAMHRAQRTLTDAANAWARRHGVTSAEDHLPLKVKERHWFEGENGNRLFGAISAGVVGAVAAGASRVLGSEVWVSAFFFATGLVAAMALIVFPRKQQVVVTPSALIIDGVAISFEQIVFIEERARFADAATLNITHQRITKLTVRPRVADEIQRAIREWRERRAP